MAAHAGVDAHGVSVFSAEAVDLDAILLDDDSYILFDHGGRVLLD